MTTQTATKPIVSIDNLVDEAHLDNTRHSLREYRAHEVIVVDTDDPSFTCVAVALPCECGRWVGQYDQD
jgi:hypothetical protein